MSMPTPLHRIATLLLALAGFTTGSRAQEACLKGCAYPPYPGMVFTLGDGFVAKGNEEIKVTHMGFLGSVYNNDGITPRKVGVPDYIGELSVIDPVTGEEKFLFRNQADWVTHANDSGKWVSLGIYPKGAPVVFKYLNVDGKTNGYKTFSRYSGDNVAGVYDFSADPVLRSLAIHGRPKPVSGGSWNWEGNNYNKWCVAANVPGTDEKQFQFEDADDRIFNDIVFRVSGVALVSETYQLETPAITGVQGTDGNYKVSIAVAAGTVNQGSTIFYTDDGSIPTFDSTGAPKGTTRIYSGPIDLSKTATVKAIAFKPTATSAGGTLRYKNSPVAEATFTILRRQLSAPTANPSGGVFMAALDVSLSQAEGAPIHYRLCDPGAACPDPNASSLLYTAPLALSGPKVIKAMAIHPPDLNSPVATFSFTAGQWSPPAATPAGGGFPGSVTVSLSQGEGAAIRYRLCDVGAACPDPDASSPLYAAPLSISGAKVLKAMAIQAPLRNSEAAAWTFTPLLVPSSALYLDRDGDGRIESAVLGFGAARPSLPPAVLLTDPFTPGKVRTVAAPALSSDPAEPTLLRADFASQPFASGTGFATGPFGAFAAGHASFGTAPFPIADGAGPVALSAEAKVSLDSGSAKALVVHFSESLASPGTGGALPFAIKRGAEDITSRLHPLSVEPAGPEAWRYTFSGDLFPLPGDSLKAVATARDTSGNPSNQARFIPVGGTLPPMIADLRVGGGGCVRGKEIPSPVAWKIPINVIAPRNASSSGCVDARLAPDCLDCRSGEWRRLDPRRPGSEQVPTGPEIKVTTRFPFAFDLRFFNTSGEFVNAARGAVSEEMLDGLPVDAEGNRTVSLQWYPVSEDGRQAATGAYVAKGTFTVDPPKGGLKVGGLPVAVAPVTRKVALRFGYMRN